MKKYVTIILLAIAEIVSAQSIKTTVVRSFDAQKMFTTVHSFAIGDTVIIHAFKKKSDKYNFVVETDDYTSRIVCLNIPFDVTEKQLKKLPNALGSEMGELIKNLQKNVDSRQKQKCLFLDIYDIFDLMTESSLLKLNIFSEHHLQILFLKIV